MVDRATAFSRVYRLNTWQGRDDVRSGPGSSNEATRDLSKQLPKIIADLGVTSVLDVGCGDGRWMPKLPGYIGIDVAGEAVARARERFPDRTYQRLDAVVDELPVCGAIICRDVLQHLPLADGLAMLDNFRRSGARYLLANTHLKGINVNIRAGRFYRVDLEAEPFSLGEPLLSIFDGYWPDDDEKYPDKCFGVWPL